MKDVSRRSFLKAGATVAATAGIMSLSSPITKGSETSMKFNPAASGDWCKQYKNRNYGGAKISFVENNDKWLGTTQIVGKVNSTPEADEGFYQAAAGKRGPLQASGFATFSVRSPLSASMEKVSLAFSTPNDLRGKAFERKLPIPDPEAMSKHIKDLAYFMRADEVGIAEMKDYMYYSTTVNFEDYAYHGKTIDEATETNPWNTHLPYGIVIMNDQGFKTLMASTGYDGISISQSYIAYSSTAFIATMMAGYIRNLGYNAEVNHYCAYGAVMTPIIIAAGMGELSRTGDCAVDPRLGFRHKVACVTTDLPLVPDKPLDFGLQDFCRVCKKCADNCPSEAITHDTEPTEHNGYMRWASDMLKCTEFRITNMEGVSCGRCVKVCPWNSKEDSWFHKAGVWVGSRGKTASSLLKSVDDMFGYGTEELEQYKWWIEWPERYKVTETPDYSLFFE